MSQAIKAGSILALALGLCAGCDRPPPPAEPVAARARPAQTLPPPGAQEYRTDHYAIFSTANAQQTLRVATAVEALHRAYAGFFRWPAAAASEPPPARMRLILYRDKPEFSRYNTSMPWAEAYYRKPYCHAYYAHDTGNPYHWMLHEATHQLNAERGGIARAQWINEGLATYFGTSQLRDNRLWPGRIDPRTYPVWWLDDLRLTGSVRRDIAQGRLIALRQLIDGSGPAIGGRYLNTYYLQYWSLSHFLFHYRDGRYAEGYRDLIRGDGSLAQFEARIGPVEQIQQEWYDYLLATQADLALGEGRVEFVPVER